MTEKRAAAGHAACPRCGTALANAEACPRCLLELGLKPPAPDAAAESASSTSTSRVGAPRVGTPPTLEEVRAAFPELEIEQLIARGGMGSVFKARQPKLERLVALKVLARELGADPTFAERFLREARALARLSHPGIVAVHDFGCADGFFYLSMEYVDGVDLRRLMRQAPLAPRQALAITRELCDALQYAHDEGVVHRDIKPENVLLDARGRVKVADFGLAKLVDPSAEAFLTRSDQVMGTPHYMAPEQLERPRDVDHRADLFALGVVLYEMLTGSLPRGNFEPPSHRVHVDVRLDEIVLKALAREPERRYQHALEVKTDVDHVDSTPPSASKSSAEPAPREARHLLVFQLRGGRALVPFALCWIALSMLWNAGALAFGLAIPIVLGLLAWLIRLALRAEPELAAELARATAPRRTLRGVGAVLGVAFGLAAIYSGQWSLWELGTPHWQSAHTGANSWSESWIDDPWPLARLASAPSNVEPEQRFLAPPRADVEPALRFDGSYVFGPLDPAAVPSLAWYALIALGFVLLALAIYAWLDPREGRALRRRARLVALELAGQAAAAWALCWLAAAANFFGDVELSGHALTFESPVSLEETTTRFREHVEGSGLALDVDQRTRIEDKRDGATLARVRIVRAQAESPFERWRTSGLAAHRKTPQFWATLTQPTGSERTTVMLQLGLYPSASEELAAARTAFDALVADLER